MAFNPYQAINAIYNLKGEWEKYNAAGDTANKNAVAEKAKAYYQQLIDSGYADAANQLKKSNYAQAKAVKDYYAKQGKSAIRPYLYSSGEKHGLTQQDIDKALSFDNTTGEVSLGGKNIGKPYSIVDGVSYWDTSALDTAFSDYLKRIGVSNSLYERAAKRLYDKGGMYDTEYGKYGEQFDVAKQDPLSTETAKSILARYDAAGIKARDSAVASGAASNAGNIDSYAAANAMRQNAALRNMGEQTAIAAHSSKVANMGASLAGSTALLQQLGINVAGLGEEERARLNDQVSREAVQAQVTGYVPQTMSYRDNPYFNPDGTLKNESLDYSAVITNARAQLAKTTDPTEKANLQRTIEAATQARNYKITTNPAYAKYADTMQLYSPAPTAATSEAEKQRQHDISLMNMQTDAALQKAATSSATKAKSSGGDEKSKLTPAQVTAAFNNGIRTPEIVNEYNRLYGTNEVATETGYVDIKKPAISAADASKRYEAGDRQPAVIAAMNYYYPGVDYSQTETTPSVTNLHGDSWVLVSGYGRVSWQELLEMVNSGEVIEKYDYENNTVTYTAAK